MDIANHVYQKPTNKTPCESGQIMDSKVYSGGQGKCAATILADQGDIVTVITDVPYNIRSRHVTAPFYKGHRAMHKSTLQIPTQKRTDYTSTYKQYSSGVGRPVREPPYGSQHVSQVTLGRDPGDWATSYTHTFINTDPQSPAKIHLPSFENRLNMSEGSGLKKVMTSLEPATDNQYWSQYTRVHNVLGCKRGPGEPQQRDVRRQYNPLTGNDNGAAWQDDNRRISGNRVLYNQYRKNTGSFIPG